MRSEPYEAQIIELQEAIKLLADVEDYIARTGIAQTRLVWLATGDANLLKNMRKGAVPRPATAEKLRSFMARHPIPPPIPRPRPRPKDEQGPTQKKLDRLLKHLVPGAVDECWPYTGTVSKISGHGQIFWDGRLIGTHRAAYMLFVGPIADGLHVCHKCDNPPCCNPDHLWLGTHRENMLDMRAKGRGKTPDVVGEANAAAKLTEADVLSIRASDQSGADLARHYGVSRTTICEIRKRKTWAHLEELAA